MSGQIIFDILDYWHAGAGHGAGRRLDAVVVKSPAGLPYLPGRTVKGLLRDAVWLAEGYGHLEAGCTQVIFGSPPVRADVEETQGAAVDQRTRMGILHVGSATLSQAWERYAESAEGRAVAASFFDELASTALDDSGQVKDRSLRRIEVAIPLRLQAYWCVAGPAEQQKYVQAALETAVPLLRRFGLSRHRGLGRVQVSIQGGQGA